MFGGDELFPIYHLDSCPRFVSGNVLARSAEETGRTGVKGSGMPQSHDREGANGSVEGKSIRRGAGGEESYSCLGCCL